MAKLYFRYGTMNCGKTTLLMQVAYNYQERGMKVLVIKPFKDTKGEDKIVSRLGLERKVDYLIKDNDSIYEIINKHKDISCLLVDEVNFFKSYHINELLKVALFLNIPVICYGLRNDFQMNSFEGSSRLLSIAHSIEEMKTICRCGKKALYVIRKINNIAVFDGEQIVIDNTDGVVYESVCGECYFKYKNKELK